MSFIQEQDTEVFECLKQENRRQEENLEMIASENFVSRSVLEAYSSTLTNKYAEGYPGKRYYNGCENADNIENIAIKRAKKLFNAEYVNVQPHSGSQANIAVFFSCLNPGDTFMGMDLNHGGHLSHGSKVNFSGKYFQVISYCLDKKTERINYDQIYQLAKENKPKLIIAGASAYSRIIDFNKFAEIAEDTGAKLLADIAHIAGFVAVGLHPSPVETFDYVTTTTHKTLRGPRGGLILSKKENEKILNSRVFPFLQGGPLMHVIAAKSIALGEALSESYKIYMEQVLKNARVLSEILQKRGLRVVSGGTDNHIVVLDVSRKGISGKDAANVLDSIGITANKNAIPFDQNPPQIASGVRFGSSALTTRGFKEAEFEKTGHLIANCIENITDQKMILKFKKEVEELSSQFPMKRFRLEN